MNFNQKGVSIMMGYVILIIIAISLSIATFAYLKLYLPKNQPKCYEGVAISIDYVKCVDDNSDGIFNVSLNLTNRGLFNINSVFIRIGEPGRLYKKFLNEEVIESTFSNLPENILKPDQTWNSPIYDYSSSDGVKELEIEPLLFIEGKPALCENAVVTKNVQCTTG